jgi:hypothetical protein
MAHRPGRDSRHSAWVASGISLACLRLQRSKGSFVPAAAIGLMLKSCTTNHSII